MNLYIYMYITKYVYQPMQQKPEVRRLYIQPLAEAVLRAPLETFGKTACPAQWE